MIHLLVQQSYINCWRCLYNTAASSTLAGADHPCCWHKVIKWLPKSSSAQIVGVTSTCARFTSITGKLVSKQLIAGAGGRKNSSSGIPAGHRAPLDGLIRWVFHCMTASRRSCLSRFMKQNRRQSVSNTCPVWNVPLFVKEAKRSSHHCVLPRRRWDHHASMRWLAGEVPYMWVVDDVWRRSDCNAASFTFSVPQSVRRSCGQPPNFSTAVM